MIETPVNDSLIGRWVVESRGEGMMQVGRIVGVVTKTKLRVRVATCTIRSEYTDDTIPDTMGDVYEHDAKAAELTVVTEDEAKLMLRTLAEAILARTVRRIDSGRHES